MELQEYQQLVRFLAVGDYPDDMLEKSRAGKNRRANFKTKAKKFFLKGDTLYRLVPGNINGAEVVMKIRVREILDEFHGSAFGGHSGINKTTESVRARYWWFGLTDDVKKYVKSCEACQKSDPLKPPKKPHLQSIKVSCPFELVGVDLVGPLAETESGNKYIFTATDYYTKWVEAFPIPSKHASVVAKCFQKLFARHGAMNAFLTDQGREFINEVNSKLCDDWNIKHKITAAYHPQTNGLDERTNQTLKATLRKMVNSHQTDWDDYIDGALFAQRTKPQCSTKYSPFFLLYGREAVYPSQLPKDFGVNEDVDLPQEPSEEDIAGFVGSRQTTTETVNIKVKENVNRAQEKQQRDYTRRSEKGRQCTNFVVGNRVLLHNSAKTTTKRKGNLQPNYSGPYVIMDLQEKRATLKNTSGVVLKKKVNVDQLKIFQDGAECENQLTESTSECVQQQTTDLYIKQIHDNGSLDSLIDIIINLRPEKPKNPTDLKKLLQECPMQSFVADISKEAGDEMDKFATKLLPHLRHLKVDLSLKTTLTTIVSAVCVKAARLHEPLLEIAETLKHKPNHMKYTGHPSYLHPQERLVVGGETLELEDLSTLEQGQWLNDKVVNSFMAMMKTEQNTSGSQDHVFVLPSYTAVLWDQGNLQHWMFKKVHFSKYRFILMPICVNANHWVLLVANVRDRTVTVYDSLNGDNARWIQLWSRFMEERDSNANIEDPMGAWTCVTSTSNQQNDGDSCGVYTLMNAECIINGVPVCIMRQFHVPSYRDYVKARLLEEGSKKLETSCDMPDCRVKNGHQRWVQCCVCGGWYHTKCTGLPTKAAIEEEFECCFCNAQYK